jgi:hypothetical protein
VHILLRSAIGIALTCAISLAQAIGPGRDSPQDLLVQQGVIAGGQAALPSAAPGQVGSGPYIKLIYPSAIAANGPNLYVADSAQGVLLRIDTFSQSFARLLALPPAPGVRLKTGPDGSVYILRFDRAEVDRFSREGYRLASFSAMFDVLRPADLVVDPRLNQVWISDGAGGVFAFHPSGRKSHSLAGRGDGFAEPGTGATLLAAGGSRVVGIDPGCRCVLEFDSDGTIVDRFGAGELINPSGLALDSHGRTWIIDRGDRRLKVFDSHHLIFAIPAARLGLTEISAISIDHYRVFIADAPGGKIGVYGVLPP